MIYTEQQILEKSKKILKDLQKGFYKDENIKKLRFDNKEELMRGENIGKIHPSWIISINEPVFDNSIFLTISDETGEPLYIQNKHAVREIEKDADGNYKTIK